MFHVLIVDDEIFSVEAILCAIDWKNLNVDEVFSAYNMKMAKNIFAEHQIDVMLCDIEMPRGNGIELAAWVKEHSPKTVNIFLTCHSDFQYAKEAVSLGAFEYLLKPIEYPKLQNYLSNALEEYQKRMDLNSYKDKWFFHHEIVQDKFWSDLLLRKSDHSPDFLFHDAKKKDIDLLAHVNYLPVLVRIQNYQELSNSWYGNDLDFAFRNIIYELLDLKECYTAVATTSLNERMILLRPAYNDLEKKNIISDADFLDLIKPQFITFSKAFQQYFHAKLSIMIGKAVPFMMLPEEYDRLHKKICATSEKDSFSQVHSVLSSSDIPLKLNEWVNFVFSNRPDLLTSEFDRLFSKDLNSAIQFYDTLVQAVFIELLKKNISAYTIFSDERLHLQKDKATLERIRMLLCNLCIAIFEKTQKILLTDTVIDQIKSYIAQNLSDDLSREHLARHFFLNPDYLSRLFKKETGYPLQVYIVEERIKKAKFLLETTDLSISEIHEQVGFTNSSYFSKIFKRETGLTPQEYRQQTQTTQLATKTRSWRQRS